MTSSSASELEAYLHLRIPLSAAMQVSVAAISPDAVSLGAPLRPNINHKSTVFGGSASALAILSAWSLVHLKLVAEGVQAELVIQSNRMDYAAPITSDFTATATLADGADWARFATTLARRRRARIRVASVLACNGAVNGKFEGEFVALGAAEA
ncbi:YiiD C-terminal domain-containing protein [Phenylobacterium sp. LjRoot219]|uniref:YiiD C-terminal domain-containing protein n=1 Tax=Phenylobacterium sp. LjRoot219 TaxID=3342283 RepID=UPI003ECCB92B